MKILQDISNGSVHQFIFFMMSLSLIESILSGTDSYPNQDLQTPCQIPNNYHFSLMVCISHTAHDLERYNLYYNFLIDFFVIKISY